MSTCKLALHMQHSFSGLRALPRKPLPLVKSHAMHAGLMGGHSGLNINEDRGNAVRFAARVTDAVIAAAPGTRLCSIAGGDKRNAIPREATVCLLVLPFIPAHALQTFS